MSPDEVLRWIVAGGAVTLVLGALLGGLLTPVTGRWRDGERLIDLTQLGPIVRGTCELRGGGERYKGLALFGWVLLTRFEHGTEHLTATGFTDETIPLLEGRPMARLRLRLRGGELRGVFEGRKFTFTYTPPRIVRVARLVPTERVWKRA